MPPERPNVLLVCTDQQRPDWMEWNPEVPVRTPRLADLADRGVRFSDAVCPSPVCNPSRACLATGMEYDRCGVPSNDVDLPLDVDAETHQEVRRNYAAMVEHLDRCLGRLLDRIDDRGERGETLVVFTSDHGEMLGDHGQWQKLSPLHASVGVPLVAAGAGVADQDPRSEPVTTLDLHATVLDVAGLDTAGVGASDGVDSRSMCGTLGGGEPPREVVHSGLSSWRMAYDGEHKLIEGYDPALRRGAEYEPMRAAPEHVARRRREREAILHRVAESETENVADDHPEVVAELHERIAETVTSR